MSSGKKKTANQRLSSEERAAVEAELERVLHSAPFAGSPRLQAFLSYVVNEGTEGRGREIRAKSVAVDVYDRKLEGEAGLNLVRVEARRLRRLLAEYYESEGKESSVRISMASGGYRPQFDFHELPEPIDDEPMPSAEQARRFIHPGWILAVVGLFAAVAVGSLVLSTLRTAPLQVVPKDPERVALRERSVPTLQAKNMADQARGMLFPVFDRKRQEIALGMFQHAIELDPALPDGHAGYAQTIAIIGIFTPDADLREERISASLSAAERALNIAPADAWANGAMALALASSREYPSAIKHARIALDLAEDDGHVLDLVGMTAILANEPALAASASDPTRERRGSGRFGARNIWAVSQLMLGNYAETVKAFDGAAAVGAPVSPPSLLFQAVAYERMLQAEKANELLGELFATWPDFPAEFTVEAMFADGSNVEQIVLKFLAKNAPIR
ncbi:tetratricopeptide repeat protein [Pseudoruegeria sp. SHC-113]|uniref:tetratricopeptide repeat protein n=1 Tax=Pseudoruegeria sp. SHC-113 TaxID=2855439 RepID=UPI0021BA86BA|nr:hypothetical protein [Pseudoruegeria sp. SHC-113]MCT8160655.1 hypothetical protein [Pseudoruegeria sp. SHC-113]